MSKQEKVLLFILACVQFTHIMDFMIMMPLGNTLMEAFSISPAQFSLIVSSYTMSAGISSLVAAFFIDRFDRKKALFWLFSGFVLGTFCCALAPTYEVLIMARILTGAFGGVSGTLVLAIVGDAFPHERRAGAMGYVMASFSIASVAGVPFGYWMAAKTSWHFPFWMLGGIGLFVCVLIWFKIGSMTTHMEHEDSRNPWAAFTNVYKERNQQIALLFVVLLVLGQFTVIPFIAPYMESNVGFKKEQVTLIYLIGGALTFFTSPYLGRLADKVGQNKIYTIFHLLTLIPLVVITNMPRMHIAYALMVTAVFFVTSGGRWIPAQAMITGAVKPSQRGGFMSLNSSVQQLAAGLASLIAGLIVVENPVTKELDNYPIAGYIAVGASLVAIVVARKLKQVS